ncbi:hypothetical protein DFW101_0341 [Solidesulfovibrio carbinoliphilus subsp. oakridgensis]|uniref:Host-nuclease inhibitor protein Gam n=1 Tax=Solidesulfovibrio carbinoliphilus subsp. oakridgensis TaxID=694327 RepID=G7QD52_9BACT|nr:host-nuclease inhibitor Gam family protein [Solidesulfovibrio carbinoliphilus]EHJ46358.1 hypothetical protein DFW101_0341 [Solidesulfovibrio carbinoliphilus subsp. oakridgensis]
MARQKPKAVVFADIKEADAALAELSAIKREIAAVEGVMNDAIDNIKAEAKARTSPLTTRLKDLETALANFAVARKQELFPKKKSLEMTFGIMGFRQSTKLKTLTRITWKLVLERLESLVGEPEGEVFRQAIRVKPEVDKEAMRDWPDERLATVGVHKVAEDEFFYELKTEAIENAAA